MATVKFPICLIWKKEKFTKKSNFHRVLARLHPRFLKYSFFLMYTECFQALKSGFIIAKLLFELQTFGSAKRQSYTASLLWSIVVPTDATLHLRQWLQVEDLCNYGAVLSVLFAFTASFCCSSVIHAKPQGLLKDRGGQSSLVKALFSQITQASKKK